MLSSFWSQTQIWKFLSINFTHYCSLIQILFFPLYCVFFFLQKSKFQRLSCHFWGGIHNWSFIIRLEFCIFCILQTGHIHRSFSLKILVWRKILAEKIQSVYLLGNRSFCLPAQFELSFALVTMCLVTGHAFFLEQSTT